MADFSFDVDINVNAQSSYGDVKDLVADIEKARTAYTQLGEIIKKTADAETELGKAQHARAIQVQQAVGTAIENAEKIKNTQHREGTKVTPETPVSADDIWGRAVHMAKTSNSGEYSLSAFDKAMSALPEQIRATFGDIEKAIMPAIVNSYRKNMVETSQGKSAVRDLSGIVSEIYNDRNVRSAMQRAGVPLQTRGQDEDLIRALVLKGVPTGSTGAYYTSRGINPNNTKSVAHRVEDAFSSEYIKKAITALGTVGDTGDRVIWRKSMSGVAKGQESLHFGDEAFTQIASILKNNAEAMRVAEKAGLVTRTNGTAVLSRDITLDQFFNKFQGALLNDVIRQGGGLYTDAEPGGHKRNIFQNNTSAARAEGYTAAINAGAHDALEKVADMQKKLVAGALDIKVDTAGKRVGNWVYDASTEGHTEARRKKEQYTTVKVTPFDGRRLREENIQMNADGVVPFDTRLKKALFGGGTYRDTGIAHEVIAVNENEWTRYANSKGLNAFNDRTKTDAFRFIGLGGYDSKNKEHRAQLESIFSTYTNPDNDTGYIFGGIHGLGDSAEIRLIKKDYADAMNKKATDEAVRMYRDMGITMSRKELDKAGMLTAFKNVATGGFDFAGMWKDIEKMAPGEERDKAYKAFNKAIDAENKIFTESNYYSGKGKLPDGMIIVTNSEVDAEGRKTDYTRGTLTGNVLHKKPWEKDNVTITSADGFGWLSSALGNRGDIIQSRIGTSGKGVVSVVDDVLGGYKAAGISSIDVLGKGGLEAFDTSKAVLANFDLSMLKDKATIKTIAKEQGAEAVSNYLKAQIQMFGINSVMNATDDEDSSIIGAQANRQALPNIGKAIEQAQIRATLLQKMRSGDADTIYDVLYNRGNSQRFSQITWDRNAPLNDQVLADIDNWANSTMGSMVANEGKLFDTRAFGGTRSGYGYRKLATNNIFSEYVKNNYGSDEMLSKLATARAGGETDAATTNFMKFQDAMFAQLGKQFSAEQLEEIGLGANSANRDRVLAKMLSLEGLYGANGEKLANVFFDKEAGVSGTLYRNPGQFGESFTGVNLYNVLGKALEAMGENTSGTMLGTSALLQLSGADFDGDNIKNFGIRDLNLGELMSDLGLHKTLKNQLEIGTLLSTLNAEGTDLAINEKYGEQIKQAIERRQKELDASVDLGKITKGSDEYAKQKNQIDAMKEIANNTTDTYSFLHQNVMANKILTEAMQQPGFAKRVEQLNQKDIDSSSVTSMIAALMGYSERSIDAASKMGGASNIAANISGAFNRQLMKGGFQDVSSTRLQSLGLEAVIGNNLYDAYSTLAKKPLEVSDAYMQGVFDYSKTGTPISRLATMWSAAKVKKLSNGMYGKGEGESFAPFNISAKLTNKEGQTYDNPDLIPLDKEGKTAINLQVLKTRDVNGTKTPFGFNARALALNTLGFTSSDFATRAALMINAIANPDEAQQNYQDMRNAFEKIVNGNTMFHKKTIWHKNDDGTWNYELDENGKKETRNSMLARNGATHSLMLANADFLAGELSGKRFGLTDSEIPSLTKMLFASQEELHNEAEYIAKQEKTIYDKEKMQLITKKEKTRRINEEGAKDTDERFANWGVSQIENELKKDTGWNVWAARLGVLKDSNGYLGGFGTTNAEMQMWLNTQHGMGVVDDATYKALTDKILAQQTELNNLGEKQGNFSLNTTASRAAYREAQRQQKSGLADIDYTHFAKIEENARSIDEAYKSLGAAFEELEKSGGSKDFGDILSKHGLKDMKDTLEGVSSMNDLLSDEGYKKFVEFTKRASTAGFTSFDSADTEGYAKISTYARNNELYLSSTERVAAAQNEIAAATKKRTEAEKQLEQVQAQLKANPQDEALKKEEQQLQENIDTTNKYIEKQEEVKKAAEADVKKYDEQRFNANAIVDTLGYREKLEAAQHQLYGLNSQYKSVLSPFQGMQVGATTIAYDEQKDFFEKAQQNAFFKYKGIQEVIDNPLTDEFTREMMTRQLNNLREQETQLDMLQYRGRVGQLLGVNLGPTYAEQWNSGYQNRLNELNSLYASPDSFYGTQLAQFVRNNRQFTMSKIDFSRLTKGGYEDDEGKWIADAMSKDEIAKYYESYRNQYDKMSDKERAVVVGYDAITKDNLEKNLSYIKSSFQGKSAEEIKAQFNENESKQLSTALRGLSADVVTLRQAASTGDAGAIEKFTAAFENLVDVFNSLNGNAAFKELMGSNSDLATAFAGVEQEAKNSNILTPLQKNVYAIKAENISREMLDLWGTPNIDMLADQEKNARKKDLENLYHATGNEEYNTKPEKIAGYDDVAFEDGNFETMRRIYYQNLASKIEDNSVAATYRKYIEQEYGVDTYLHNGIIKGLPGTGNDTLGRVFTRDSIATSNYIDIMENLQEKINNETNEEAKIQYSQILEAMKENFNYVDKKDLAAAAQKDATAIQQADKFLGTDWMSSAEINEAYIASVKASLEKTKKDIKDRIKANELSDPDKAKTLTAKLNELNKITDEDIENNVTAMSKQILNNKKAEQMWSNAQFDYRHDTLGQKAMNTVMSRFGRTNFNQAGNYLIESVSSQYEQQLNSDIAQRDKMAEEFKSTGIDPTKYTGDNAQMNERIAQYNKLNSAIAQEANQIAQLKTLYGSFGATVSGALQKANTYLTRFVSQMGRKLVQEAKKFIKEFEASMTTIQAITLKSDEEMESVRSSAIEKAKELKVSVSSITKIQESLYRQGLSDEEVNNRTDIVAKYSAVTGQDISGSLKSLTVAVNSGLVDNLQEAADVLVALGDAAATTAAEIAKGLQKSATSAANAGMTYEELTALLTVGTSKTQLGGSQIGRSVNSILSRMHRVTNEGYSTAEDGTVSINDVETALSSIGVKLRDGADNFRSATDIFVDIASVWEDLTDIQKANVSYTLAGTTQSNVFQTLMAGLAEDDSYKEYLETAENSEGTLDSKFEIIKESLNSSLTALTTAFDSLVENMSPLIGLFKGLVDGITSVVNFFSDGGILGTLAGLTTGIAALYGVTQIIPQVMTSMLGLNVSATALNGSAAALTQAAVAIATASQGETVADSIRAAATGATTGTTGIISKILSSALFSKVMLGVVGVAIAGGIAVAVVNAIQKANSAETYNAKLLEDTKTETTRSSTQAKTFANTILDTVENNRTTMDDNATLKSSVSAVAYSQIEDAFNELKEVIPGFGEGIDLATVTIGDFTAAINGAKEATDEYTRKKYAEAAQEIKYDLSNSGKINQEKVTEEAFEAVRNGTATTAQKEYIEANFKKIYPYMNKTIYGSYNEFVSTALANWTPENFRENAFKHSEYVDATDVMKEAEKRRVTNIAKQASDALAESFSSDEITSFTDAFVSEIGDTSELEAEEIRDKWATWLNENVLVPILEGTDPDEIVKKYAVHKYQYINANGSRSSGYYYSADEAAEAGGTDTRHVIDITTGKIVGDAAQDYLTTTETQSERNNKNKFASYVLAFDNIGDFFADMNSSTEKIEMYAGYLSDETLSEAAQGVLNGTKTFKEFQEAVLEYVNSVVEGIAFSSERMSELNTYGENTALWDAIINGTATQQDYITFASQNNLPTGRSNEYYTAWAKSQRTDSVDALNAYGDEAYSEFVNTAIQLLISNGVMEADAYSTVSNAKNATEILGLLKQFNINVDDLESTATVLDEDYKLNKIERIKNPYVTETNDAGVYNHAQYGTVSVNENGDLVLYNDVVDAEGKVQYIGSSLFGSGEIVRLTVAEWNEDGTPKTVKTNDTEDVINVKSEYDEVTGKNRLLYGYEDSDNWQEITALTSGTTVGSLYTGGYTAVTSAVLPTAYQTSLDNARKTGTYNTNANNAAVLEAFARLKDGETAEAIYNDVTPAEKALLDANDYWKNITTIQHDSGDASRYIEEGYETAYTKFWEGWLEGIESTDVQSYGTATTSSDRLSALTNLMSGERSNAEMNKLYSQYTAGTISTTGLSNLASYLGVDVTTLRSNPNLVASTVKAKNEDQKRTRNEYKQTSYDKLKAAMPTVDLSQYKDMDAVIDAIASGELEVSGNAADIVAEYQEWKSSIDDVETAEESLNDALKQASESLDTEKIKSDMTEMLSQGKLSEVIDVAKINDDWTAVITSSTEATRIIALYEAGLISAENAAKQLAETMSTISPNRSASEINSYATAAISVAKKAGFNGGDWQDEQAALNEYLNSLSVKDPTGYAQTIENYSYLEKMGTASSAQEYKAAYDAYRIQRWAADRGVSDEFSGMADTIYAYGTATSAKDRNEYAQQLGTQFAEYEYYADIINRANRDEEIDEATLKEAENYFGGFAYDSEETAAALSEFASTMTELDTILKTILSEEQYASYKSAKEAGLKSRQESTSTSAAASAAYTAQQQSEIDEFYDWIKQNPDADWSTYSDWDKVKEISDIATAYYSTDTTRAKNKSIASLSTIGKQSGVNEEMSAADAALAYSYIAKGDFEGLRKEFGNDTPAVLEKVGTIYGTDVAALAEEGAEYQYGSKEYSAIVAKGNIAGRQYYLSQQKDLGLISEEEYNIRSNALADLGKPESDRTTAETWSSAMQDFASREKAIMDADEAIAAAQAMPDAKQAETAERAAISEYLGSDYDPTWDLDTARKKYNEKKKREQSAISSGRAAYSSTWADMTDEERAKLGLPTSEEEYATTYQYDYRSSLEAATEAPAYNDEAYENAFYNMLTNAESPEDLKNMVENNPDMARWIEQNQEAADIYKEATTNAEGLRTATNKYAKSLGKDARSVADFSTNMKKLEGEIDKVQKYLNKGSFDRSDDSDDLKDLASILGLDEDIIKGMSDSEIKKLLQNTADALAEEYSDALNEAFEDINVNDYATGFDEEGNVTEVTLGDIKIVPGQVYTGGIEEAIALARALGYDAIADTLSSLAALGGDVPLEYGMNEDGTFWAHYGDVNLSGVKGGNYSSSSSSGGGGSGESAADKAMKNWERKISVNKHRVNMVQKEEEYYENAGELTNYGTMLKAEQSEQEKLKKQYENAISGLTTQLGKTTKNSDDWYELRDKIMEYEEAAKDCANTIEELNKKLEENQEAIRQTRIEIEQTVRDQIEENEQIEEDKLSGEVSLQNEILDAIKQRYQDEWDLLKEDIEKKKEALEKEKTLLQERVDARRDAEDAEEKEEELAEYKRQLALVSMDSSRTKDALELQEKISELEKEISRDREDELLQQQQDELDQQSEAYDDMIEAGEDELETFLSDANNFAEELNSIMEMSQNDLLDWLSDNVAQFALSTQAAQEQMLNSWTDTYEQYKHIVEMWNEEIDDILSSKDKFLEYMKTSDDYVFGDEETRESLLYDWGNQYDDMVNALKTGATWSHSDSWASGSGSSGSSISANGNTISLVANTHAVDNNTTAQNENTQAISDVSDGLKDFVNNTKQDAEELTTASNKITSIAGDILTNISSFVENAVNGIGSWFSDALGGNEENTSETTEDTSSTRRMRSLAYGGIMDYTGTAILHGSASRPEYVLNTDEMNALVRNLTSTYYTPPITTYTPETKSSSSVGDIYITINEAALGSDTDINELAARVGEAFSNELGNRGFNTRWNI